MLVAGTRPECIKLAPVHYELKKRKIKHAFVHSGQHYDRRLTFDIINELNLDVHCTSPILEEKPTKQLARLMQRIDKLVNFYKANIVVMQGDTNTTLAGALVARKRNLTLYHVEAGLRSWDWRQPEEHNRRIVDHIADVNFTPTSYTKRILKEEGITNGIRTGNTVIDLALRYKDTVVAQPEDFGYLTLHRAETVDNEERLSILLQTLGKLPYNFMWPLHPRTKKRINQFNLSIPGNISICEPVSYLQSLMLLKSCKFVATDSGGLVEEATVFNKPVVILREYTDRPEAISAKQASLVGKFTEERIKVAFGIVNKTIPKASPFGDGHAAERICDEIIRRET